MYLIVMITVRSSRPGHWMATRSSTFTWNNEL